MSLPKKGTRLITVDGVQYRWLAREEYPTLRILVQSVEMSGALLSVTVIDGWPFRGVLPSHAANVIQKAIRQGWKPLEAGPPFVRDVELKPFGGQDFDPKWRTEAVLGIAATIRDTLNYSIIPILADALEEAGCQNQALLTCCREQWQTGEAGRVITLIFANL
jgi:hypothetical protein